MTVLVSDRFRNLVHGDVVIDGGGSLAVSSVLTSSVIVDEEA